MTGVAAAVLAVIHVAAQVAFILRALLRPHRDPASRVAWVLVLLVVPVAGIVGYVLFGEANVSKGRAQRYHRLERLFAASNREMPGQDCMDRIAPRHRHLFRAGRSVNGFDPVDGNTAQLLTETDGAVDAIVADMDAATDHVHLLCYIWLNDTNGQKVAEAAKRAARRGVTVRALADNLGSRRMIRSAHWAEMEAAGVRLARAMPLVNPFLHPFRGRIDLRNHRKIVVIDDRITYSGSQNFADAEFRIKARYAPWVDVMVRFTGPVARQNQYLFAQDWMAHVDEDLRPMFPPKSAETSGGVIAQAIGTGPTVRASAMPEMFGVLIHAAREELVLSTPYYVPTEAMQDALCAAAHRGVDTRIVFPAHNDSWLVAAASRSYYQDLLAAGVRIYEFPDGLLHAKTLTLDREVAMIGSANLDRRSFELNFENNILLQDADLTASLRARQQDWLEASDEVLDRDVAEWSLARQLWNNSVAMLGPLV
ncbi:cardiolipin synthase [Psychromarinibacter sp. C21-152]|uniref:Cardiolipin synthase n=1 Tax=Psychromarinibacter sediminicola TaxID=3033385 RepID=A0AAE3NT49_9RHOB|nr:cardiolipin synthase [Psychromarinibacter sediminicola]MDF0601169.1 cardiolipin synthase [Psychromarinibacter sediminicola]